MNYLSIKSVDGELKLSKIALGTGTYGTKYKDDQAFAFLDYFVAHGGNVIDTARVYAEWEVEGKSASELCIGRWIKARNNRDKIIIFSKCAHPHIVSMDTPRVSEKDILEDIDESLKCLGVDYVDIYGLHRDNEEIPVEIIVDTMHHLVCEGKIKAFAVSNWRMERILQANEYAKKTNKTPITISQIQWSYAKNNQEVFDARNMVFMNDEEYDLYKKHKIPVMAFSSQAKGFMLRANNVGIEKLSGMLSSYICDENLQKARKIKEVSDKHNKSITELTIKYITDNDEIDGIALTSISKMEQLEEVMSFDYDENCSDIVNELRKF